MTKIPTLKRMPPPPSDSVTAPAEIKIGQPKSSGGHRTVLYGPGGIGKTTLVARAPGPILFVDADESLGRLKRSLEASGVPVPNVAEVNSWAKVRSLLRSETLLKNYAGVALDSGTKIEEWAVAATLKTVLNDKGKNVSSIEGYGFGKGYQHAFETFLHLLSDLDRVAASGINVFVIAHDCVNTVPNPSGEDWIRYEPRFQDPSSGKASIRRRIKEWADHVLFLGYDVDVKDGVGTGSGTRTLYTAELPQFMAKSRTCQEVIPITDDVNPWELILV